MLFFFAFKLIFTMLKQDLSCFENSVDPDHVTDLVLML